MAQDFKRPEYIEGGCLCKSLRWKVTFPEGTEYPPESLHCHCTMCRKGIGAFVATFLTIHKSQFTWTTDTTTLTVYDSSEEGRREFCNKCGGSIIWRCISEGMKDKIMLGAATIDEEILHNKELGVLQAGKKSYFCKNYLPGIDDGVKWTTLRFVDLGPDVIDTGKA